MPLNVLRIAMLLYEGLHLFFWNHSLFSGVQTYDYKYFDIIVEALLNFVHLLSVKLKRSLLSQAESHNHTRENFSLEIVFPRHLNYSLTADINNWSSCPYPLIQTNWPSCKTLRPEPNILLKRLFKSGWIRSSDKSKIRRVLIGCSWLFASCIMIN